MVIINLDLGPIPDSDSQNVWIQIRNTALVSEKWPDSGSSEIQRCKYRSYRTPDPGITILSLDNAYVIQIKLPTSNLKIIRYVLPE